jgi:uncharacterized DUF497 family protein
LEGGFISRVGSGVVSVLRRYAPCLCSRVTYIVSRKRDCGEAIAMKPNFEWDEEKAQANLRTHKVSFDEATTVFSDPFSITIPDPDYSTDEERYIDIGTSDKGRLLVVSYTERGTNIRIISCRKATPTERRRYEEGND